MIVLPSDNPAQFRPGMSPSRHKDDDADPLRRAARALEAEFIAEMLRNTAPEASDSTAFGRGSEYNSIMIRAQAQQIADAGGIGMAEALFHALSGGHDER